MANTYKRKKRPSKSVEVNTTVLKIMFVTGICLSLVIANVLFTMFTGIHFRSGKDVLAYKSGSGTLTEKIIANRGYIYDRNKEIIAQDIEAFDLVAVVDENRINATNTPAYVVDVEETSEKLAEVIGCKKEEIQTYLDTAKKNGAYQTEFGTLGKSLTAQQKETIESMNLPGIEFMDSTDRRYPLGTFASQLVGYAQYNYNDEKISGVMGLESYFDKILSGEDGEVVYQIDSNGYYLPDSKKYTKTPVKGSDIYLTIDVNVQSVVEEALRDTMEGNYANWAQMIVMEADSGKVLAQAGYPSFNLNEREDITEYQNLPSQLLFEPGSIMKPFVYAGAMEAGVYNGKALYDSGSKSIIADAQGNISQTYDTNPYRAMTIRDALGNDWGNISLDEGLIRSSNTAIVELLTKYYDPYANIKKLKEFGFFSAVDLYGMAEEVGWMASDINKDDTTTKITIGFGQGGLVTGYQMIQAASALFSKDGKMLKPYIIDRIVDPNTGESTYVGETEKSESLISESTATQIQELMKRVVTEEYGTATQYEMPDITLMAKTGTGEVSTETGYSDYIYNSSIIAAAPAEDPKIIIFYAFQSPNYRFFKTSPFQKVVREALVAVDGYTDASTQTTETAPSATFTEFIMPSLVNHTVGYAMSKLNVYTKSVIRIGDGDSVITQYPASGENAISNQRVFLLTDGTNIAMPNMTGWSRKDVKMFASMAGFDITIKGSGSVVSQTVKEGTVLNSDTKIQVKLK